MVLPRLTLSENFAVGRARAKPDGTRAETTFRLSPKRTNPYKSAGASVQSTAGSRGMRISVSNAGYTTFRGRVRVLATHSNSPVSPSLPLPCVTVCHHIPNAVYHSRVNTTDTTLQRTKSIESTQIQQLTFPATTVNITSLWTAS